MKRILTYLILIITASSAVYADYPRAFMKVEYEVTSKSKYAETGETKESVYDYVLKIGDGHSFYCDPQTNRIDSLRNDPQGSIMLRQAEDAASEKAMSMTGMGFGDAYFKISQEMGLSRRFSYKNIKDFKNGVITVWDNVFIDHYRYPVEMSDLQWELVDSTKNVMGYECQLATADYHGRKWLAWFAQDIPVQDGPWQLCGLPGLILEAQSSDGNYGFVAKGIQQCDEPLGDPYENPDKIFKTKRISFFRMKYNSRKNRGAQISALTGGKVNPQITYYEDLVDFIETDYHEP